MVLWLTRNSISKICINGHILVFLGILEHLVILRFPDIPKEK